MRTIISTRRFFLENSAGSDPDLLFVIVAACADIPAGGGDQALREEFVVDLQDLVTHIPITVILGWNTFSSHAIHL